MNLDHASRRDHESGHNHGAVFHHNSVFTNSVFTASLNDDAVDEVIVHRGEEVWTDRDGLLSRCGVVEPTELQYFLEHNLSEAGRHLDRLTPMVDARLRDGSRLCAVIPPIAVDGIELSIRRHRQQRREITAFANAPVSQLIHELVVERHNIVVSGPTSSGKTTFLSAMLTNALANGDRIVAIEDTCELQPQQHESTGHIVHLEARQRSTDGSGEITLHDLLVTALRLRPDRIVVGEVRGAEVVTLIHAMNTGHDGSMSTCHANSPADAVRRLSQLMLQHSPNWPERSIVDQLHRSIDAIIQVQKTPQGNRVVTDIVQPTVDGLVPIVLSGEVNGPLQSRAQRHA